MSMGEGKFLPYQPLSGRPRLSIRRLKDPWVWKSEAWLTVPLSLWSGSHPSVPSSKEASTMALSEPARAGVVTSEDMLAPGDEPTAWLGSVPELAAMMRISSEMTATSAPPPARTRAQVEGRRGILSGGVPRSAGDGLAGAVRAFGGRLVGG